MKEESTLKNHHGAGYFIEKNKDKNLTLFIVDDNEFYSNLLQQKLTTNTNFKVYRFNTGEKCLENLSLRPNLIILDFHLDGKYPNAQKGDVIYTKIKEQAPDTEVIILSSDHKLALMENIRNIPPKRVMFKDINTVEKIKCETKKIIQRRKRKVLNTILLLLLGITFATIICLM